MANWSSLSLIANADRKGDGLPASGRKIVKARFGEIYDDAPVRHIRQYMLGRQYDPVSSARQPRINRGISGADLDKADIRAASNVHQCILVSRDVD
jgi:hypothetical protein